MNKECKTLVVTEWLLVDIVVATLCNKKATFEMFVFSTGSIIRYRNLITVTILARPDGQAEILENINIYLQ